jgi:hypothetical protein
MRLLSAAFLLLLLVPATALGVDSPPPQPTLALPTDQVWTLIAGVLSPVVAYALNFAGPWASEKLKALVQVGAAAIAGGLTQAIVAGGVGFNGKTLQFVITAIFAALTAHKTLWQPSGISTALGGGRNKATALASPSPSA